MNAAPANNPPVIEEIGAFQHTPDLFIYEGDLFTYQVVATDADGDELTYALDYTMEVTGNKNFPPEMTINENGLITWQTNVGDAERYMGNVIVSDGTDAVKELMIFNVGYAP